jgi:hypothetical protein
LGAAIVLLAIGAVILPFPPRRHVGAGLERCAAGLRQIGLATHRYLEAHGQMPQRLSDLLDQDLAPDVFVCSASKHAPPTREQLHENPLMLDDSTGSSYTYVPLMKNQRTPDYIQAFDTFEHRERRGINVLFGDGRVDWVYDGPTIQHLRDDYAAGVRPLRVRPALPTTKP